MTRLADPFAEAEGFAELKAWLIRFTGMAYYADKDDELRSKLRERLEKLHLSDYQAYLDLLCSPAGAAEADQLIQRLTIGETYFFRYREQLEVLRRQILPELLASRRSSERLSVWSAGCATGEEAYTLAILLHQTYPQLLDWDVEILATDINPAFLEHARHARYRERSFRQADAWYRDLYFQRQGDEWELRPLLRPWLRFASYNLVSDDAAKSWPAAAFDLIVCRNVLIYFDKPTQREVIQKFYNLLQPQGWLMLGSAELTPIDSRPFPPNPLASMSCFRKSPQGSAGRETEKPGSLWLAGSGSGPRLPEAGPGSLAPPSLAGPPFGPHPLAGLSGPPSPPAVGGDILASRPSSPVGPVKEQVQRKAGENGPQVDAAAASKGFSPLRQIQQLANQGKLEAAAEACRQLMAAGEMRATVPYLLGVILSNLGENAQARQALQQALYLDHRHCLAHYRLGLLQQQAGQPEAARKSFANAERLLQRLDEDSELPDGEGMLASELTALIQIQRRGLK